jgi:hypothetical protein
MNLRDYRLVLTSPHISDIATFITLMLLFYFLYPTSSLLVAAMMIWESVI